MNTTSTIYLHGTTFLIDIDAYQLLTDYLKDIESRFSKAEKPIVMNDVEARIAGLFRSYFSTHPNSEVVDSDMVRQAMNQMGNPDEFGHNPSSVASLKSTSSSSTKHTIAIVLKVLLAVVLLPIVLPILLVVMFLVMAFSGVGVSVVNSVPSIFAQMLSTSSTWNLIFLLAAAASVIIPLVVLIVYIVTRVRFHRTPSKRFWWITLPMWLVAVVLTIVMAININTTSTWMDIFHQFVDSFCVKETEVSYAPSRELDAFHSIYVEGNVQVDIYQSDIQDISFNGDATIDSLLLTQVHDSVLFISFLGSSSPQPSLTILIPELRQLSAGNGSTVIINDQFIVDSMNIQCAGASTTRVNVVASYLRVSADGASQIHLEGESSYACMSLNGASTLESEWLQANVVELQCAGASQADVMAVDTLSAIAQSGSSILYVGEPFISQCYSEGGATIIQKK